MINRLVLAVASAGLLCGSLWAAETRPNVLFVVIDNVDFAYMGQCYGGDSYTPQLDRIAERGVTFRRAYATTPLCVPSRYTCLTGRYASRCRTAAHGYLAADDANENEEGGAHCALEADLPNLPRVIRQHGYATGFVGKYHLEQEKYPRFECDETSVFDPVANAWLKKRRDWLSTRIRARGFDYAFNPADFRSAQFRGIDFERANHNMEADVLGALTFIEQNRDKPFFLYLSPRLLHLPIDPKLLLRDYDTFGRVTEGGLLYVMDRGRIVEQGNHEQLVARRGKYFEMARLQAYADLDDRNSADGVASAA